MSSTEKAVKIWDKVLRDFCGCYPDVVGNRPCDNGALCDRCMTKEVRGIYRDLLRQ